jgi:hypothetical protein
LRVHAPRFTLTLPARRLAPDHPSRVKFWRTRAGCQAFSIAAGPPGVRRLSNQPAAGDVPPCASETYCARVAGQRVWLVSRHGCQQCG